MDADTYPLISVDAPRYVDTQNYIHIDAYTTSSGIQVDVLQNRAQIRQSRQNFVEIEPKLGEGGPTPVDFGASSCEVGRGWAEIDQSWTMFDEHRPSLAGIYQIWVEVLAKQMSRGRSDFAHFGRCRSKLAEIGRMWADSDQVWAKFGPNWENLGRSWPGNGRIWVG